MCRDGTSIPPGFIFSGKEFHPEWFQVDDNVRYVELIIYFHHIDIGLLVLVCLRMVGQMTIYAHNDSVMSLSHRPLPRTPQGHLFCLFTMDMASTQGLKCVILQNYTTLSSFVCHHTPHTAHSCWMLVSLDCCSNDGWSNAIRYWKKPGKKFERGTLLKST